MGDSDRGGQVLRVLRGQATEEELTALTVVLLARRAAAAGADRGDERSRTSPQWWRIPEVYQAPRSWR
ncbi:acyl-CoA carboxylase subunit epsilon [Kitasatospora sp. NPDC006697]|uniref:acyl-CoA carboxylase subunit epsilon n=1 Tax=Kitasatospora sp. NPDC006697 TaxID=3364020 RepID=UPI0036ABCF5A